MNFRRCLVALVPLIFVTSCTSLKSDSKDWFESSLSKINKPVINNQSLITEIDGDNEKKVTRLSSTENEGFLLPTLGEIDVSRFSDEKTITISVEKMPLPEFINYALNDLLKVDYVIDSRISNFLNGIDVTLNLTQKISPQHFFKLVNEQLNNSSLDIVEKEGVFIVFQSPNSGNMRKVRIGYGQSSSSLPGNAELILQIVPLNYANPAVISEFLSRVTIARASPMEGGLYLLLQGYANDVARGLKVIQMLDVPAAVGKHIAVVKLNYMGTQDFIGKISELMNTEGYKVGVNVKFTELARHSSVVVHGINEKLIDRVEYWAEKLDLPQESGNKRYLMYIPENSKAADLASALIQLLNVASNEEIKSVGTGSSGESDDLKRQKVVSYSSTELSVVADNNRNALVFYTTASKYNSLLPILKQLDVLPTQVLLEAKFIEVTLTDKFNNGIDWSFKNGKYTVNNAGFGKLTGGFNYSLTGVDYKIALNILEENGLVKVLSSPSVMVANGESATITVGTEVPVLTNQSNDVNTERVLQSVQYRSTGVTLTVEPTINSKGTITMKVQQNVSETGENKTSSINSPIILNRSIDTKVIGEDGKLIVMGGLIRENNSFDDKGVPLLRDLPLIGEVFGRESESKTRTELVLMITPKIVHNTSDLDEIRNVFLDKMTGLH